ncbi:MAG: hypothetical protein KKI08_05465 [Armatimonadetes bacterium]|nr:hypothetical protein [Armatimonadota bacterium]
MVKVILSVLAVLLVLAYGAFFLTWNLAPQQVVGFSVGGMRYTQTLPLGSLVFVGLVIGAAIMACASWSAWATQKATADKHAATIRKAKVKLQNQLDEINDLRDQVARLEAELASLQTGDGTWGKVNQADIEAGAAEPGSEAPTPEVAQAPAEPEVDDPDVI